MALSPVYKSIKAIPHEIKQYGEEGIVLARIATLGVVDSDGDITVPGAFGTQTALLSRYAHNWGQEPVGRGTIYEQDSDALFDGRFNLDMSAGREMFSSIKFSGDLQEWSYGFRILDADEGIVTDNPVRYLKRLKVIEVSPVMEGAGVNTGTVSAKGCEGDCGQKGAALGRLLRRLRDERDISNGDLATAAGVSSGTISQLLRGSIICPPLSRLRGLAAVLDVNLNRLIGAAEADGCSEYEKAESETTETHSTTTQNMVWSSPPTASGLLETDAFKDAVQAAVDEALAKLDEAEDEPALEPEADEDPAEEEPVEDQSDEDEAADDDDESDDEESDSEEETEAETKDDEIESEPVPVGSYYVGMLELSKRGVRIS